MRYTAGDVRARVSGSQFFIVFGSVWLLSGLAMLHRLHATPCSLVLVAAVALIAAGLWVGRRSGSLPEIPFTQEEKTARERTFKLANVGQYVAMAMASIGLIAARRPDYILPVIAIIVGLHLLPLARSFRYPPHYITGMLTVMWAVGCMLRLPRATVAGFAALGTGAILVTSAAVMLLVGYHATEADRFATVTKAGDL